MKKLMIALAFVAMLLLITGAFADVEINATNFPDENFRAVIKEFDLNNDDILSDEENREAYELSCSGMGIKTLQGMEYLTDLGRLYCSDNLLTSLDISGTNIAECYCENNHLQSLKVNDDLQDLRCRNNDFTVLDVSGNSRLMNLVLNDMRHETGEGYVYYQYTITYNLFQPTLYLDDDVTIIAGEVTIAPEPYEAVDDVNVIQITRTNFPDDAFRTEIIRECDTNGDGWLSKREIADTSEFVMHVDFSGEVDSLKGIEYFTELRRLLCFGSSNLKTVDLSSNKKLYYVNISGKQLNTLNISACQDLKELYVDECSITSIDLSQNQTLQYFSISGKLTKLNVKSNTKLEYLNCANNALSSLNLTKNKELKTLYCEQNQLRTLDISQNMKLEELYCYGNQIESLDFSKCKYLKELIEKTDYEYDQGVRVWVLDKDGDGYSDYRLLVDESVNILLETLNFSDGTALSEEERSSLLNDLARKNFIMASGHGAWSDSLLIDPNGTYSGTYSDSDAIGPLEDYGVCYYSNYKGGMRDFRKINDHIYAFLSSGITYEAQTRVNNNHLEVLNKDGTWEITDWNKYLDEKDGVLYLPTANGGLGNDVEIFIARPGSKVAYLPEYAQSWTWEDSDDPFELPDTLKNYFLFTKDGSIGFLGTNRSSGENNEDQTTDSEDDSSDIPSTYTSDNLNYSIIHREATVTGVVKSKTKVKIPNTILVDGLEIKVTAVADNAFKGDTKITRVIIGENVTLIGSKAFYGCIKLKTVSGGAKVDKISDSAFYGDKVLTSITLKGIATIGKNAFFGCVKLKSVTFGAGLTAIGQAAFKGCKALAKITIPSKVSSIGKQAFMNCSKLKTITIKH